MAMAAWIRRTALGCAVIGGAWAASVLPARAATAPTTTSVAVGATATATFTTDANRTFTATVQGDPAVMSRVYVTYTVNSSKCTGSAPVSGVILPDPTVSSFTMPRTTVLCADSVNPEAISTITFAMSWVDHGSLGVATGPQFVGLARTAVATISSITTNLYAWPWPDGTQTSAASMGLGVTL